MDGQIAGFHWGWNKDVQRRIKGEMDKSLSLGSRRAIGKRRENLIVFRNKHKIADRN